MNNVEQSEPRRRAIELRLRRTAGMNPLDAQAMMDHHDAQADWKGVCTDCGKTRMGTPSDLSGPCPHCHGKS